MTDKTDYSSETAAQSYDRLLKFFQSPGAKDETPIAHPDKGVEEMAQAQLHSFRKAAVLIPVTRLRDQASQVVLTVRSENLKSHAGQISLPGGSMEPQDKNEIDTALRESHEEIGLHPKQVEVVGQLGELALPSGFRVKPVVGIIENDLDFVACPIEVADIFTVPLDLILDPDAYRHTSMRFKDQQRAIVELHFEDYRIWGATAAILYHLAMVANDTRKF
ncbi:MAG: CoA pyrophosphatase [Gammaproteobacteria bacterium]